MHFRNDTLDFALLLPSDSFCALENVGFMRHATDKLPVILSVIEAGFDHLHDEVSKRTTCRIRPGVGKISQAAKSLCINRGKKRRQAYFFIERSTARMLEAIRAANSTH